MGGAENVLEVLVEMFPNAPVFTTIYGPGLMPPAYRQWDIRPSWLNRAPGIHRHHQPYLPFYPAAVQSLDFSGYDVILSNKSGFIHGLRKQPGQVHLCYCLTPTRYAWMFEAYAQRENLPSLVKQALRPLVAGLQRWDYQAAQNVDAFCAISSEIQDRIARFYKQPAALIAPPVDTTRFQPIAQPRGDYYFIVSRLIPYKRLDLAVQACTQLGRRLIIAGDGRDRATLEALAGPTVELKGRLPWDEVVDLMANCRAFIFPGDEDFGITPVEAQAAGRPVIAYASGGALDTVIEGETGLFFREQSVAALSQAILNFEAQANRFHPATIRRHAEKFSISRFKQELTAWIEREVAQAKA
jgi:glycosyltransferase involved in cell wall biosynthesis